MLSKQAISSIAIFKDLTTKQLTYLQKIAKIHHYKKGALFFNSSQFPKKFFYILTGAVKLFRESLDGSEVIISILDNRHYFAESFIFSTAETPYQAKTLVPTQLITLPIKGVKKIIYENSQIALMLLKDSFKVRQQLIQENEHLIIQTADQRIGYFLLKICNSKNKKNVQLRLPYEKNILASRLGMKAETFSRALLKLSKRCHIQLKGNLLFISNIEEIKLYVCQKCSQRFPSVGAISKI